MSESCWLVGGAFVIPTQGEGHLTPDPHPVCVCREGLPWDLLAKEDMLTWLGEMWTPDMHHGALEEMLGHEGMW